MLLQRYMSPKRFREIENCEFFASSVLALNDPFEFGVRTTGTPSFEVLLEFSKLRLNSRALQKVMPEPDAEVHTDIEFRMYVERNYERLARQWRIVAHERFEKAYRAYLERDIRVVCFCHAERMQSAPADEVLLWSHYTDGHKGFRISIEFPDAYTPRLNEVVYSTLRVGLPIRCTESTDGDTAPRAIMEGSKRKSASWAYEHEVRLIFSHEYDREIYRRDCEKTFLPFKVDWVRSLDIGCNASQEFEETVRSTLAKQFPSSVRIQRAFADQNEFRLLYRELPNIRGGGTEKAQA